MNTLNKNECDLSIFRNVIPIERSESPTQADFERLYLKPPGRPVILTDVAKSWPALSKWSFDFFSAKFGKQVVVVSDRLLHPTRTFRMPFSTFLNYCKSPNSNQLERFGNPPLYLGFQPFANSPELLDDFSQPPVASCIYDGLTGDLYKWYVEHFGVILIGSAGTVTLLHADLYGTHGWLAQICGRKHWLVFPPQDAANLYQGKVDLLQPDLEAFPKLRDAQPYEAVVSPGEVIFVPSGWYHHVVSLDPSISFGFNFVNQTNFLQHVLGICRDLPKWTNRISSPGFREPLSISWTAADFTLPQISSPPDLNGAGKNGAAKNSGTL